MTRILIVDDELAYNLTHADYRVFEARNAFDAIEAVHDESVDLVLLDCAGHARHRPLSKAQGRRAH